MDDTRRGAMALVCALAATPVLPLPATTPFFSWYDVGGIVSVLLAVAALAARRPPRRWGWVLVISGFGGWVAGDLVYAVEAYPGRDTLPAPSDAVYLGPYLVIVITAGMGVLAAVFVIEPLFNDSALSFLATSAGRRGAAAGRKLRPALNEPPPMAVSTPAEHPRPRLKE